MAIMQEVVRLRYQLLPLWYVLFYESHKSGLPMMRPLWVEFPQDENTYEMDDQFMVGSYLMVKPVVVPYATSTQVYLPGQNAVRTELVLPT
jgi:alpha-glucosidase (family GH31 glycosyl hydrolase)